MSNEFKCSKRLEHVAESATLKLNARVQAMRAAGQEVFNLTAGEPDFAVDDRVKEAVRVALNQNRSKYTAATGIVELREKIVAKTNRQHPSLQAAGFAPWKASEVVVTNGGKQALMNAMFAILNPGDEVLIPSPFWLSYPEMVKLADGTPRLIPLTRESGYTLTAEILDRAITPRTRMLVINSPSNPTGAIWSREQLSALGEVLLKRKAAGQIIYILSDEIYDEIILGDVPFCSFLESSPQLRNQVVTVNGLSKSAAMTGWRVGWSVASSAITQAMGVIQGQMTSGINSLAQYASLAALDLPESYLRNNESIFRRRKELVFEILTKAAKLDLSIPGGAFYAFVGVGRCLQAGETADQWAERLLEKTGVAVVGGNSFGDPHSIRLSFATDEATLSEGCRRLIANIAET
jgi:aspartate aminotransferase